MNICLLSKIRDFLRVSRLIGWVIAPLVFIIGFIYSNAIFTIASVLQIILLSFPYSILLFGINDINDRESDRINPRKNVYVNETAEKFIYRISLITVILLLSISIYTLNLSNVISTVITILFSYFYSAYPVRLKEIPFIDSFSNGIIFFAVFSMGYSFGGSLGEIPLKIYWVALCVTGIHAFGAALDYEADKAAGNRTVAVYIGVRGAFLFTFVMFFATYLFAGIGSVVINIYLLYCAVICIVAFIFPVRRVNLMLFKMIFAGFVLTSVVFLFTYGRV